MTSLGPSTCIDGPHYCISAHIYRHKIQLLPVNNSSSKLQSLKCDIIKTNIHRYSMFIQIWPYKNKYIIKYFNLNCIKYNNTDTMNNTQKELRSVHTN